MPVTARGPSRAPICSGHVGRGLLWAQPPAEHRCPGAARPGADRREAGTRPRLGEAGGQAVGGVPCRGL